jgi:integrase
VVYLPKTKNGEPRAVPLSPRALEALDELPARIDGQILPAADLITHQFGEACERAKVEGLTFHDLRHEATSRLFERGLQLMEVAAITGHKDIRMLRRYTHLRADDLAEKLAQPRGSRPANKVA